MKISTITETKSNAVSVIKSALKDKKIPSLSEQSGYGVSWFYKVAAGTIKPSYERSLIVLSLDEAA